VADVPYVPEWERIALEGTEQERRAYFKAHEVRASCEFAIRPGTNTPLDILAGWAALYVDVGDRVTTAPHKRRAAELRTCWRRWMAGQTYQVPGYPPAAAQKPKPIKTIACPHCGGAVLV